MKEAAFSLNGYRFPKAKLDMSALEGNAHFDLVIKPEGVFHSTSKIFVLNFLFQASVRNNVCIEVLCSAEFSFKEISGIKDIPSYFYANSIAILFPYVRAFVSTLTLQANYQPIVLPTMNLSDLSSELKEHVKTEN